MKRLIHANRAFTLVEVTLALGIVAFCLTTLVGLLPVGLRSTQAAIEQTAANGILSAVVTDLRATPPSGTPAQSGTSQQFQIVIPVSPVGSVVTSPLLYFTGDGQVANSPGTQSRYLLTIKFLPTTGAKNAILVSLQASWPAGASLANATGSVQTFVALNRN